MSSQEVQNPPGEEMQDPDESPSKKNKKVSGGNRALEIVAKLRSKSQGRSPETNTTVQLPLWSETSRGLPNALARGAIFSARNPNEPRFLIKGEAIASLSNIQVAYRGEDLRQDDSSVFMNLLHIARTQPLGNCVYFTGYSMLMALRWGVNGPAYEKLKECISGCPQPALQSSLRLAGNAMLSENLWFGLSSGVMRRRKRPWRNGA